MLARNVLELELRVFIRRQGIAITFLFVLGALAVERSEKLVNDRPEIDLAVVRHELPWQVKPSHVLQPSLEFLHINHLPFF